MEPQKKYRRRKMPSMETNHTVQEKRARFKNEEGLCQAVDDNQR